MKSISCVLLSAAIVSIAACTSKIESSPVETKGVEVCISGNSPETKTVFGTPNEKKYPVLWTENKEVSFSLDEGDLAFASPEIDKSNAKYADFHISFPNSLSETKSGTIYAFSPKGTYDTENQIYVGGFTSLFSKFHDTYVIVPTIQTPLANSCDESAHIMAGETSYTDSSIDNLSIVFHSIVAYGKMTITNFENAISSVSITFPVAVAGNSCRYYYEDYFKDAADAEPTNKKGSLNNATESTITINATNVNDNVFWFACAPIGAITSGQIIVAVTDDNSNVYKRTITLTEEKSLAFNQGEISSFRVSMKDSYAEKTWNLSIDETTSATEDQLTWVDNNVASMSFDKNTSTTAATNYYPSTAEKNYTSTRVYKNYLITIAPVSGISIKKVVFTTTSESYATALVNSTWTNASATSDGTDVIVSSTNGASSITALLGATVGIKKVVVYYSQTSTSPVDATWTLDPISIVEGKTIKTTIETDYDGTLRVVSNDETKATATIEGKEITVTGVAEGSTTLTIRGDATSTRNAIEKTVNVTVTPKPATVTDVLEASMFAATTVSYTEFSNVSSNSDAKYAGKSAKNTSGAIQLRSSGSDCGIVTTASGGKINAVRITVASGANQIDIYGKNTPYSSSAELYSTSTRGTLIGTLNASGTITVSGDYEYIGFRANKNAVYISSIEIDWK